MSDMVERLAEKFQQHWQGGGHKYTRPWDNGTDKDCVNGLPGQAEFFRQLARIAVSFFAEASGLSPDFSAADANTNVDVNHPSSNGNGE